jgi:hypothetical protein
MEQHAEEKPGTAACKDFFLFDGRKIPSGEAFHQDDAGADPRRASMFTTAPKEWKGMTASPTSSFCCRCPEEHRLRGGYDG